MIPKCICHVHESGSVDSRLGMLINIMLYLLALVLLWVSIGIAGVLAEVVLLSVTYVAIFLYQRWRHHSRKCAARRASLMMLSLGQFLF
jgi:hypothetical protein